MSREDFVCALDEALGITNRKPKYTSDFGSTLHDEIAKQKLMIARAKVIEVVDQLLALKG